MTTNSTTTTTKTTTQKIDSKRCSEIPGDTRRVITSAVRCTDGTTLRVGTVYQPLFAGETQTITVLQART